MPDQIENQDPQNQASSQDQTPTSINQETGVTNPQGKVYTEAEIRQIHELYGQALRENEAQAAALRQQLAERQQQQVAQPQNDDILQNPRQLIQEEIQRAIAPLQQTITGFAVKSQYESLKDQFRAHPQYSAYFSNPQFVAYLDGAMANAQNVSVQSMSATIAQIVGYMAVNGQLNTPQPAQQQNGQSLQQQVNQQIDPPHLRPSSAPLPGSNRQVNTTPKGTPKRQLTENERRIAREQGFTEDEYLDWLTVPSNKVITSDIGTEEYMKKVRGGQ